ncbi:MAG: TonB-dependent receptor [Bryobacteraceae bacterium]|nr:TonB-dependent receptor [Bryobacteraceae bacterium]MDW8376518.1 TonB-dependent receptor [Bryobacterales bacterium]
MFSPVEYALGCKLRLALAIAAVLLMTFGTFTPLARAQVETGVLTGTVTDPAGAVVVGAKVSMKNVATALSSVVETNETGRYVSGPLRPGEYEVTASAAGFKTAVLRVRVEVAQRISADFRLELGAASERVTIEASSVQLESETSTLGNIRPARAVAELPLNARNFATLIFLSPGTVPSFDRDASGLPGTTRRGVSNASINGVRPTNDWNSLLIEGVDNTENHNGFGAVVFPSVEAIQEFKVQTSAADAQFGRAAGGFTNVVIKSGSRDFHGSLFHFLRNSEFDAKNFFATPGASTHFVLNQFGGTLGGPLLIPKLYNRSRDKTFFFISSQFDRRRQAQAFVSTIPTPRMRAGDFSESASRIFDPLTLTGNTRQPFAGNIIPASRFNSAGKGLIDLYPNPNRPGLLNNYASDASRIYNSWQTDYKIDHYFRPSHSFVFRGSTGSTDIVEGLPLPLPAAGGVGPSAFPVGQYAIIDRIVLSPTRLNEFRFGFTRMNMQLLQANIGRNVAQELGIAGVNTGDRITSGLPRVVSAGFQVLGDDPFNPGILVTNNFQLENILYWTKSKHSLRFGVRIDRRQYNAFQSSAIRGIQNFTGVFTNNPAAPAGTGISLADLLLGAPTNGNIVILEGLRGFRRWEHGYFVQDDWKVNTRLTLNLGLRYEIYPSYPWVEVGNRGAVLQLPSQELVQVGTQGVPRSGAYTDGNNFAPRVGLALRLTEKTVLRSAYGVYYAAPQFEISRNLAVNPPFAGAYAFVNNQLDFINARKVHQGFERTFFAAGATIRGLERDLAIPYVQQWNLNIQRQLPGNTLLTVAYVGTKGVKLRDEVDLNIPLPGPGPVAPRRPYPMFTGIINTDFRANSNYHGLQATFEKRYSEGLSFLASYTWGHAIDDAGLFGGEHQDMHNLRLDRGSPSYDVRQTFLLSFNYELSFARNASGLGAALLRGWQMNGILRLSTGFWLTPTVGPNNLNTGGLQRPDVVPGCSWRLENPRPDRWFNPSCFSIPVQFTFGNAGRGVIEGPGTRNLDFSLFRNFYLTRGESPKQIQLRGEVFNLTNTPQFNNPVTTIGVANSAVISSAGSPASFQRIQRQIQLAARIIF